MSGTVKVPYGTGSYEIRPDETDQGMLVDEIVCEGVSLLHMEALDKDHYWFGLYFGKGRERLTFCIYRSGKQLKCNVIEKPRQDDNPAAVEVAATVEDGE